MKPSLSLVDLKLNRHGQTLLEDINLDVYPGELVALIGPSGAGKSTLFRLISGLQRPSGGRVFMAGEDVTAMPPQQRPSAMVMDTPALFGHMTVNENVAFAVNRELRDSSPDEQVMVAMTVLNIRDLADRYPNELSMGQRQKVSLARTLVRRPKVLLFDEPLAHVDSFAARTLRDEILRVHRRMNCASIYITHDVKEAFSIADRIIYLEAGRILQDDLPQEIHDGRNPSRLPSTWAPPIFRRGRVPRGSSTVKYWRMHTFGNDFTIAASPEVPLGDTEVVIIGYQDSVHIEPAKSSSRFPIRGSIGQIVESTYTGENYRLRIETERGAIEADVPAGEPSGGPGDLVTITLREDLLWALPANEASE